MAWNPPDTARLWVYNLHYFDYLSDEGLKRAEKIELIKDFWRNIKRGKIILEAYPTSLRLVNWILFASKEGYYSASFDNALQVQLRFLKHNLEYHILANHYLENLIALVVCAHAFRDLDLMNFSLRKLQKELHEEILEDGGHYEGSPMYHCIILSRLLILIDLFEHNPWSSMNTTFIKLRTQRMLGWIQSFAFQDHTFAHLNDSTDGIAPPLKAIYEAAENLKLAPKILPLGASGYRKFKDNYVEVLIDVGNIVPSYQPGHAHSDMLSFCMNVRDAPIFIDPGVSTYEVSSQRTKERSTSFHNTVTINDRSQSHVWESFRVAKRAHLTIKTDTAHHIVAFHDGYKSDFGVLHEREFLFGEGTLVINDQIIGKPKAKPIRSTAYFYLHPNIKAVLKSSLSLSLSNLITVDFSAEAKVTIESVDIPAGFNKLVSSHRVRVEFTESLTTRVSWN